MPPAMLAATSSTCRSPSEHGSTPCTASAAAAKSTAATTRPRNGSHRISTATCRKSSRCSQPGARSAAQRPPPWAAGLRPRADRGGEVIEARSKAGSPSTKSTIGRDRHAAGTGRGSGGGGRGQACLRPREGVPTSGFSTESESGNSRCPEPCKGVSLSSGGVARHDCPVGSRSSMSTGNDVSIGAMTGSGPKRRRQRVGIRSGRGGPQAKRVSHGDQASRRDQVTSCQGSRPASATGNSSAMRSIRPACVRCRDHAEALREEVVAEFAPLGQRL